MGVVEITLVHFIYQQQHVTHVTQSLKLSQCHISRHCVCRIMYKLYCNHIILIILCLLASIVITILHVYGKK